MAQGELGLSLYNPAQLARTELIESFLVRSRQNQLAQLAGLLDPSRSSKGPRHALLLGPRGSGKTTLLLRLAYLIEDDQALQRLWTPVLLVEEQHHIGDLTDLLLSVVRALPESEKALKARADAETVLDKSTTDTVAADFVLEILNRYSSSMGRRLLILIDNFDQILSSMESESQNHLTSILKKEQRIQFVAAAPKRDHHEILGKKLTPLFLTIHLSEVSREEFSVLLTNLALLHNNQRVLHTIGASAERLEQLFLLTGGNIRTAILMYRLLNESANEKVGVFSMLERLLDEITPLYQSRTSQLAPQQRRVFAALASRWSAVDASTLGRELRLKPNTVSAQLSRLISEGYVERVDTGRKPSYRVVERLYNVYWLMRNGGAGRRELDGILQLLEMISDQSHMFRLARALVYEGTSQRTQSWNESVRDIYYIAGIATRLHDPRQRSELLLSTLDLIKRQRTNPNRQKMELDLSKPWKDIIPEFEAKRISFDSIEFEKIIKQLSRHSFNNQTSLDGLLLLVSLYYCADQAAEAKKVAVRISEKLHSLGTYAQKDSSYIHMILAKVFDLADLHTPNSEDAHTAVEHARLAVELDESMVEPLNLLTLLALRPPVSDVKLAFYASKRCVELNPENAEYLRRYACVLFESRQYDVALEIANRAIKVDPAEPLAHALRGAIQFTMAHPPPVGVDVSTETGRWMLVRATYYHMIDMFRSRKQQPDWNSTENIWFQMSGIYLHTSQVEQAEAEVRSALLTTPNDPRLLLNQSLLLGRIGRWPQSMLAAEAMIESAVRERPGFFQEFGIGLLGLFLFFGANDQASAALALLDRCMPDKFPMAGVSSPLRFALRSLLDGKPDLPQGLAKEVHFVADTLRRIASRTNAEPPDRPPAEN